MAGAHTYIHAYIHTYIHTVREKARIPIDFSVPVHVPNYRSALSENDFLTKKIKDLLDKGIIRERRSDWNSPILLVPKVGDEKFRLVVDYRRVNKKIQGDSYPLPNVEDLLTKAGRARIFTKIDLVSGFHQIPVHEDDQKYLAFSTPDNSYPYAYVNIAPELFTRVLNKALVSCQRFCAVYVDDILIFSSSAEQHMVHLRLVLEALGKANFRVSIKKSTLAVEPIHYLGFILTPARIEQDPAKVDAIVHFPVPSTQKQVRRFLGMAGYYRKFVKDFRRGPLRCWS